MADHTPIDITRSRDYEPSPPSRISSRRQGDPASQIEQHQGAESEDLEAKYAQDVPPDGGYGWVCVACVFWINAHTWGINSVSTPHTIFLTETQD